jgi:ATP-dependent protease ClpP protease subunit
VSRRSAIRANARRDWYRIRNEADSSAPAQVLIYGEIGDSWWGDSVPASQFVRDLAEIDAEAVDFHIHSPGGDVFDGLAIATAIRTHPAKTTAYVDGLAASAASFIATAADEVVMAVGAELMIHDAWGMAMGNAADMAKMADDLDKISANLAGLYALKAGGSADDWRDVMKAETWYSADEAVQAGLADRVDAKAVPADGEAAKNSFDLSIFAHAGRRDAPAPRFPGRARAQASGRAGGSTQPTEGADGMSDLIKGLRERLGISADAAVDEGAILAALDEALNERVEPTTQVPAGTTLIDTAVLAELQANAREGAAARAEQVAAHRAALVEAAIQDGRTVPAMREHWNAALATNPDGTAQILAALPKGSALPVETAGYTGGLESAADDDRASAAARAAGWES